MTTDPFDPHLPEVRLGDRWSVRTGDNRSVAQVEIIAVVGPVSYGRRGSPEFVTLKYDDRYGCQREERHRVADVEWIAKIV